MVHLVQQEAVEIEKIPSHVEGADLPIAIRENLAPNRPPADQEQAEDRRRPLSDDLLACPEGCLLHGKCLQDRALFLAQLISCLKGGDQQFHGCPNVTKMATGSADFSAKRAYRTGRSDDVLLRAS